MLNHISVEPRPRASRGPLSCFSAARPSPRSPARRRHAAQDAPAPPTGDAPAAGRRAAPAGGKRVYTPADFARFAPATRSTCCSQVPGFTIREATPSERGLGQATGNVLINGQRFSGKSTDIFTELSRIPRQQRHPHRDRRRRDARHRPASPARSPTSSTGRPAGQRPFHLAARVPRPLHRPAAHPRRDLGQRRQTGPIEYTLGLQNNAQPQRRRRPDHHLSTPTGDPRSTSATKSGPAISTSRSSAAASRYDGPRRLDRQPQPVSIAALLSTYDEDSARDRPRRRRPDPLAHQRERGYNYELGGDYEFGLAGGRLKLIGLDRFDHSRSARPSHQLRRRHAADSAAASPRTATRREPIARGEYRWNCGQGRLAALRSRRRSTALDNDTGLFELDPDGELRRDPLSRRHRRRSRRTATRPWSATAARLSDDARTSSSSAGGEYSQLEPDRRRRPDPHLLPAQGLRQPGLASAARSRRQLQLRAPRRPAQFLRLPRLGESSRDDREMPATPTWCRRRAGTRRASRRPAISARGARPPLQPLRPADRRHRRHHPDRRDGESPGNIDRSATAYGAEWTSTLQLRSDRLARRQARHAPPAPEQRGRDPLTGEKRPISEHLTAPDRHQSAPRHPEQRLGLWRQAITHSNCRRATG